MRICLVSDLHINWPQKPIEWPIADVLIIAGDTADTIGDDLKLMRRLAKQYDHIVAVDGNHLHYSNYTKKRRRTVDQTIESLVSQLPDNVHYLGHHKPKICIDGRYGPVWFIGCNGWYSFDEIGDIGDNIERYNRNDGRNDNKYIGFSMIDQPHPIERARADAELVRKNLEEIVMMEYRVTPPIVVVTHTAPHTDMVANSDKEFCVNSHMQSIIESDLGSKITFWCHGHTHHAREKIFGGIRCVCNPRGYPRENPDWAPKVMSIIM